MRLVIVPLETRVCCSSCLGAQLERLAGATQRGQHVPLPRLEVAATERVAARPVEVAREPVDAGEHLEGREVEVGPLRDPRLDDPIDFVRLLRHAPIIAVGAPAPPRRREQVVTRHPAGAGGRLADLSGGRSLCRRGPRSAVV